uniref:Ig-like domain-containing protein n=1 Tax=Seriola lalandi dorsalis TaxID=1841481 RepID=A0A3B4YGA9_SERLL
MTLTTSLTRFFSIVFCVSGVLCQVFEVTILKPIKALSGSCVTIPCSFDIEKLYKKHLDKTCRAIWRRKSNDQDVFNSAEQTKINGELKGKLTEKDCTTTLSNIVPDTSNTFYFRLESNDCVFSNSSKCNFLPADPPSPTLTPSTLEETEGTSVRLKCSAPAPCLSQPPTLTWTPGLGDSQETPQENQDKTKVVTSVLTFTASHLHHGKTISCTATYNKQDGTKSTANTMLYSLSPVSVRPSGPVPEDTNVTLTCTSDAKPAVRNYTWYRADGGQETFIRTGQTLNITASKLTAAFICMAQNLLGTGRSNIRQIDFSSIQYFTNSKFLLPVYYSTARRNVKPKEEDPTYISLDHRDMSSEYDVIAQTRN